MKEKVHEQAHIHDTPPLLDNMLHIMAGYALNTQIIWFWNEEKSPKSSYQNFLQVCNIYAFVFKNNKILNSKVQNFQKNNAIEIYPGNLYICIFCSKKFQKKY